MKTKFGALAMSGMLFLNSAWTLEATVTLEQCLKTGQQNYEPLKLADEEVELARLKKQEAYRTLFPVISLKAEESTGETSDQTQNPGFKEQLYGTSLSQSLFEGGKNWATYQQAVASHESAERSREKTYQDFSFSVSEAYWKLVASYHNLKEREQVRDIIRSDLKSITEQYVLDLAMKQQFLAVKAQYLQANTQANQARVSASLAKWSLAKAMGLPKPPEFAVVDKITAQKVEPNLEECLVLAATHRPDVVLQDFLVEAARQGRKVAASTNLPKLNLFGFYGQSASGYPTQSLNFRDDWQVNLKLSQSIFGNSLAVNGNKIHTSPKLGQSSRTETETKGVTLNVLDGMKERTELKSADLAYRQAVMKRNDLRKDVAMDVEEAYYNTQQSWLQVEFSEEDLKLAEEEMRIAESKGKYGLSTTLELAQARNRLATSRAGRMDALASYRIALSALNRAIGIVDKFNVE